MMLTAQRKHLETPAGICAQAGIDPVANLVAAWDWRGATEAARLKDKRYAGYNGTNNGATINDGEAVFDGNNYVDTSSFVPGEESYSLFFKTSNSSAFTFLGFNGGAGNRLSFVLDKLLFFRGGTNFRYFTNNSFDDYLDNAWHHLVLTVPGGASADILNAKAYVDGSALSNGSTTSSGSVNAYGTLRIGHSSSGYYIGKMADIYKFNSALTPTQISKLHTILSARYE
jgi:hypothetical protein